ncbi:MAG: hypothetical protein OSA51_14030 [Octadecabacter sp.]|nr:hypothetical protein [Octadecabacter sp.]
MYRCSGAAFATNLSWILGAVFAPFLGLLLASSFELWAASLYMLSGAIVTACALYMLENRYNLGTDPSTLVPTRKTCTLIPPIVVAPVCSS